VFYDEMEMAHSQDGYDCAILLQTCQKFVERKGVAHPPQYLQQ